MNKQTETIMALADKYADAMERGPFSRSYQGNIQDARANLQAAVEKIAATPPKRKPLTSARRVPTG
jgi:hypothetical protein